MAQATQTLADTLLLVEGVPTIVAMRIRWREVLLADPVVAVQVKTRVVHRPDLDLRVLPVITFFEMGTRDLLTTPYIEGIVQFDWWTKLEMPSDDAEALKERSCQALLAVPGDLPGGEGKIELFKPVRWRDSDDGSVRQSTVEFDLRGYDYRLT
jgi:hypothetical protein